MQGARPLLTAAFICAASAPVFAVEGPSAAGPLGGTDIRSALLPPPGLYGGVILVGGPAFDFVNGDLWFRYDWSYQSETYNNWSNASEEDPLGIVPSWSASNFQVGLELQDGWDISLMARNIWDETNVNWLSNLEYGITPAFNIPLYNRAIAWQKPRTISLTVRKSFE